MNRYSPLASSIPFRTASPFPLCGFADHPQVLVLPQVAARDFQRAVRAPVLHHQHFRFVALLRKESEHLLQAAGQAVFLVVRRNDDR